MRKEYSLPGTKPERVYSDAVRYGNLIFTAGIVARDNEGNIVAPGNTEAQARYIFDLLKEILEQNESSLSKVIKITIYLRNMEDITLVGQLRKEYFGTLKPASTTIEVSKLANPGLLIEIEVIAGID